MSAEIGNNSNVNLTPLVLASETVVLAKFQYTRELRAK